MRLEVTRFKSDVLNLYRSHVESLSRLPEFQKETAEKAAPAQEAQPAEEVPAQEPDAQPEAAPAADAPAEQPAAETTEPAASVVDDKAADSSEDFWEKDESQLKLDPPPADKMPDEPDYDAFQGVKFSE